MDSKQWPPLFAESEVGTLQTGAAGSKLELDHWIVSREVHCSRGMSWKLVGFDFGA